LKSDCREFQENKEREREREREREKERERKKALALHQYLCCARYAELLPKILV